MKNQNNKLHIYHSKKNKNFKRKLFPNGDDERKEVEEWLKILDDKGWDKYFTLEERNFQLNFLKK